MPSYIYIYIVYFQLLIIYSKKYTYILPYLTYCKKKLKYFIFKNKLIILILLKKNNLMEQLEKNAGLKDYLVSIYKKTGYGFGISLFVGIVVSLAILIPMKIASIVFLLWITNILFSFYSIYKMRILKSETINQDNKLIEKENLEKNNWYNLFSISNGIIISPAIFNSFVISPTVMLIALACTVGIFATSTKYALKKKDLSLVQYQAPLIDCIGGLICSGLIQLVMFGFGYHNASWMLGMGVTILSMGIFSALIAVNTHMAIKSYENKQLDSIGIAFDMLLNITNLFLDFLKIIGELNKLSKNI